jgi:hypothetical protein
LLLLSGVPPPQPGPAPCVLGAAQCNSIYNALQARSCASVLPADLGGLTITPGVYCIPSAATFTTDVILDAQNQANAVFVFKVDGAFNSVAGQSMLVVNGPAQVLIACNGAATLGGNSFIQGSIAAAAAITLGAGARVSGNVYSQAVLLTRACLIALLLLLPRLPLVSSCLGQI